PVRSVADCIGVIKKAEALLSAHSLPAALTSELLGEAYDYLRPQAKSDLVKIRELYLEFRVAALRRELRGRPERTLKNLALPFWAFLRNLDVYRTKGAGPGITR